jgi:hypothetical protein
MSINMVKRIQVFGEDALFFERGSLQSSGNALATARCAEGGCTDSVNL